MNKSKDLKALDLPHEAKCFGDSHIGFEHVVIAMASHPETEAGKLFAAAGVGHDTAVSEILGGYRKGSSYLPTGSALDRIGIEMGTLKTKVEETFGERSLGRGLLRYTPAMAGFLVRAEAEAFHLGDAEVNSLHLLLAILAESGYGHVLRRLGMEPVALREEVLKALGASQELIDRYHQTDERKSDAASKKSARQLTVWREHVVKLQELPGRAEGFLQGGKDMGFASQDHKEQFVRIAKSKKFVVLDVSQGMERSWAMCNPKLKQAIILSITDEEDGTLAIGFGRDLSAVPPWAMKMPEAFAKLDAQDT